tara:strand:+ start:582 stop:881 length:300 start_codon:yes stop_codon:yes gene_type:complete
MSETTNTIGRWAVETFGVPTLEVAESRAREEMDELQDAINLSVYPETIVEEAADVVIVLCHLAATMDRSLWDAVERKMKTNRQRIWKSRGNGTAQHTED